MLSLPTASLSATLMLLHQDCKVGTVQGLLTGPHLLPAKNMGWTGASKLDLRSCLELPGRKNFKLS